MCDSRLEQRKVGIVVHKGLVHAVDSRTSSVGHGLVRGRIPMIAYILSLGFNLRFSKLDLREPLGSGIVEVVGADLRDRDSSRWT